MLAGHIFESLAPGAFDAALAKSDARAFLQHDHTKLLGRQSAGTLRLSATKEGLAYELDLPNTSYANDMKDLISRGDLTEMSFGFIPGEYKWASMKTGQFQKAAKGTKHRIHTSIKELIDISPVAMPAFEGTSIELRSEQNNNESIRSQLIKIRANLYRP
jgi:hypothetical protein